MGFSTTRKIDLKRAWRRGVAGSRWALIALCLCLGPSIAFAQTDLVVDPTTLEFTPSPDHATILRYEFEVLPGTGTGAPLTVLNLGRPTPAADGQIRVDLTPWRLDQSLGAGTYRARVTATSEGGTAPSTASNPFTFSVACSYALGATSASYGAASTTGAVTVTTSATCAWTATSPVSWITVAGGRTGSGTATLTVQANTTSAARTATLTIAGRSFTVTQAAAGGTAPAAPTPSSCRVDLSAGSESIRATGADNWSVRVTTTSTCAWTAVASASWITVNTPSGTGSGPVSYDVAANTGAARTGNITIGGWQFVLNQAAGSGGSSSPTPTCTYNLATSTQSVAAAGGANSVGVTAGSGCSWTASTPVNWITLNTTSGNANGTVNYTVAANTGAARSATLTIAGRSYTVNQAAAAGAPAPAPAPAPSNCRFDLSAGSESIRFNGANNWQVWLTTTPGCAWTAVASQPWITVHTPSGTGSSTIRYSVANNPGGARTAYITIGGWQFKINQAGR